jgi:hypothetical protein
VRSQPRSNGQRAWEMERSRTTPNHNVPSSLVYSAASSTSTSSSNGARLSRSKGLVLEWAMTGNTIPEVFICMYQCLTLSI